MNKALLKFILILFLFSVIDPGVFAATTKNIADQQQLSTKSYAHELSKVKIDHQRTVIEVPDYGFAKPLWTADLIDYKAGFSICYNTLFLQNSTTVLHRVLLFRKLLFPAHFFR